MGFVNSRFIDERGPGWIAAVDLFLKLFARLCRSAAGGASGGGQIIAAQGAQEGDEPYNGKTLPPE